MTNKPIYLEKHEVVLEVDDDGFYVPVKYKFEDKWYIVSDGDIIQDWIVFIKQALKTKDPLGTSEDKVGNLYLYQWGATVNMINIIMRNKTEYIDIEWCRQLGKNYNIELMSGFLSVFGRRYNPNLKGGKWITVALSHKIPSIKKNFSEIRKHAKKAVEIYNKLYGSSSHALVYGDYKVGDEKKYAFDTDMSLKIDVILGDTSQDWGIIYSATANANNDGYSGAKLIYADESILIDGKNFIRSVLPACSVNGGSLVVSGIASTDSSCLQYIIHNMERSIKIIYDVDDGYRLMKITNPVEAEIFKNSIDAQIEASGGKNSTESQTNYYMNWDIIDGLFTTRSQLEKNNVYECVLGDVNHNADFVVAGLDLSISNDYTVFTVGEVYQQAYLINPYGTQELENGYKHYLKDLETYNLDRQRMDANELAKKTAQLCRKYKVDMIAVDSTANQSTQVQLIYEAIVKEGINTLVVPFNFAGVANKVTMVGYLESVLFSGRCKIPLEEYKNSNKSYEIFLQEILALLKIKEESKKNIQYRAPKGFTDDHFFSFCLMVYCVPHVENLIFKRQLIEIGTKKIIPKLNKFKLLSDNKQVENNSFDSYCLGLF